MWKACNKCGWTTIPDKEAHECVNCLENEKKMKPLNPNTFLQQRLKTVEILKERGVY